jgi:ketosteroid isomerase-like protein
MQFKNDNFQIQSIMMKLFLSLFSLVCLSNQLLGQVNNKENEIRKLEKDWTILLDKNDTTALKSIWTEKYVVNNAMGKIVGVQDILALMKSGHVFPKVDRSIEKITFQDDLAIVMGSEKEYAKDGKVKNRRFTNVWIEKKDGWKLIARQATGD